MQVIGHPDYFREGTRVLLLESRPKDGLKKSRVAAVSRNSEEFFDILADFVSRSEPGQRIYASANRLSEKRAIRSFKENQLQNDYDPDPGEFYSKIQQRYIHCLMQCQEKEGRLWMLDIDTKEEAREVFWRIKSGALVPKYAYASKSGIHVFVEPFNKSLITLKSDILQPNALMLVGY